jgi:hypothetical protein
MTAQTASTSVARKDTFAPVFIWLIACAFMCFVSATALATSSFPDPDDIMRLLQVRDWMGGQSWFDVTQYRLNSGAGVPMHWSRLVDIPIATVILVARPLVGEGRAETVAIVLVPLITLGIAMVLVHRIALKLMSSRAALAAVAATPLSLGAMKQMRPMRIDHHGWQIVLALVGVLACLDDQRPRRSALVAGLAMALWLNISLEGLPFAVAIGGVFAFEWLRNRAAFQRLETFIGAFAIASLLFFGGTHLPSTWMNQQHDVVTAAYLAGFVVSALGIAAIVRVDLGNWRLRLVALGVVGFVALCAMFLVDPHWMRGPFSSLDPIVRKLWYERNDEGLAMWQVDWTEAAMGLAQPIVGLVGASVALSTAKDRSREHWLIYAYLLLAVTLASTTVLRIATTASVIAMPGTAYLCQFAFRRARAQSVAVARVASTTAALFVMTPAYAFPITLSSGDQRVESAVRAEGACEKSSQLRTLRVLPAGELASPLDMTPAILLQTDHRAIATGHHRNITGMRDIIRLFVDPPSSGEEIVKRRNVDYVLICPGSPDAIAYVRHGPAGLTALLLANRPPVWLERTNVPGLTSLEVWKVRKDLLR